MNRSRGTEGQRDKRMVVDRKDKTYIGGKVGHRSSLSVSTQD